LREPRARVPFKPLVVFAVLAAGLIAVSVSPLREHLKDVRALKEQIHEWGLWGPALYMAVVYLLVALGVPRLLFCPIGGLTFGFARGLLWTQIPTLLGYYTIFLFVRWGGRDWILHRWPKLARWKGAGSGPAMPMVILIRQLPISGLVTNLILGLSPIRHRDFLVGTVIGLLPEAIPFTLIASGLVKLDNGQNLVVYLGGATLLLIVVWLGLWYLARRSALLASLRGAWRGLKS